MIIALGWLVVASLRLPPAGVRVPSSKKWKQQKSSPRVKVEWSVEAKSEMLPAQTNLGPSKKRHEHLRAVQSLKQKIISVPVKKYIGSSKSIIGSAKREHIHKKWPPLLQLH